MTEQEIFNKVWSHMQKQRSPAMLHRSKNCTYLNDAGKKCSVGCLLPPEELEFAKQYLGDVISLQSDLSVHFGETETVWMLGENLNFLSELQNAHDTGAASLGGEGYMFSFEEYMRKVAERHKLEVPK